MLIISSGRSGCLGKGFSDPPSRRRCSKLISGPRSYPFLRPLELFTMMIWLKVGTAEDSVLEAEGSVKIFCKMGRVDCGCFLGRFVSVPIMRCDASTWTRAATTCWTLKAGFRGT